MEFGAAPGVCSEQPWQDMRTGDPVPTPTERLTARHMGKSPAPNLVRPRLQSIENNFFQALTHAEEGAID